MHILISTKNTNGLRFPGLYGTIGDTVPHVVLQLYTVTRMVLYSTTCGI